MTPHDQQDDRRDDQQDERFDALLRDLGPDVPRPDLSDAARERMLAAMSAPESASSSRAAPRLPYWAAAAGILLAAALGLTSLSLSSRLRDTQDQLAVSSWETNEALELLMKARFSQPNTPVPADLKGTSAGDLVLVTFDHELCPIARVATPLFRQLAAEHKGEAADFLTFDVTGDKRDQVDRELRDLGIEYAVAAPLGTETGVIKVLDTRRGVVLSSAPGAKGLEQARLLLARVAGANP